VSTSSPRCTSRTLSAAPVVSALLFFSLTLARLDAQESVLRYTETHGQKISSVEYRVTRDEGDLTVTSTGGDTTDSIRWRSGAGTYDWQTTDPVEGSILHGQRDGNVIHVTGTLKKKPVDKDVRVDGAPWYQVFGPLIEELLPPGIAAREFWVLDPGDLGAHKMQVRRAGPERITIKGTVIDAAKIHFSPAGALAPFWGADFWYRSSDGMYVSSRLPEKGGVTVTAIEDPNQ
jgi:hypothetical protein